MLLGTMAAGIGPAAYAASPPDPAVERPQRSYPKSPKLRLRGATAGDYAGGDDPVVRTASVEALGNHKGTVVVVDTATGRVLTAVNQKLAFSSGYMPCSTVKLVAGLAALSENLVEPETKVWFDGYWFMTMTEGLAISNNVYFAHLGRRLGFDRLKRYAHWLGLGEKAGLDIPGEQLGVVTAKEPKAGLGRMATFGDGISATPLQLAALVSALANGGTLYYLQYPRSPQEAQAFSPVVKRYLPIVDSISGLEAGMAQAVKRGTAKKARTPGQTIHGKTGTCSERIRRRRTPLGWFASYNEGPNRRLAVVVLLRGGGYASGPRAAEVAGRVYRGLSDRSYFSSTRPQQVQTASLPLDCCAD